LKSSKVLLAIVILTGLASAEDKLPPRVVRVVGVSEVKVEPDQAVIEVGVEKQNVSASVAKHLADAAARSILASLRGNGIEEKDIQTTFLALGPQSGYSARHKFSQFVAAQTMSVTVHDLSRLDKLLESLVRAGGNRIDSIRYETSELRKYRDQARDLAAKAAREKAEALAKTLGQQIGKVYSIEEVSEPSYESSNVLADGALLTKTRADASPTTAAGERTVSASVVVCFELD
jgi:uncharacterized protein YggE